MRYDLMKTKRFYVPKSTRLCNIHTRIEHWIDDELQNSITDFSAAQIVDMVDLLRMDAKTNQNRNNRIGMLL